MRNLPADWWLHEAVAQNLSRYFKGHVLPLLMSVEIDGRPQETVYSGFLLDHLSRSWW